MLIIGERINTSRKKIEPAVVARDTLSIQEIAQRQAEFGARAIDVNAGTLLEGEPEALAWLVKTVQEVMDLPLCIDSPNPKAVERALKTHRGKAMVNSITLEAKRYQELLPVIREHHCSVVGLLMDDEGIPQGVERRLRIAGTLVEKLVGASIPVSDIYLDPLVQPVSVSGRFGLDVVESIRRIMSEFPGIHTICGLSNVSYGLPNRRVLNQGFLVMCMAAGMDASILDPEDLRLMSLLRAADVLLDRDQFAVQYLETFRNGKIVG